MHLGGDVAQLAECWTGLLLRQVRFPSTERDFSPRDNFQCRLSYVCLHAKHLDIVHFPMLLLLSGILCLMSLDIFSQLLHLKLP